MSYLLLYPKSLTAVQPKEIQATAVSADTYHDGTMQKKKMPSNLRRCVLGGLLLRLSKEQQQHEQQQHARHVGVALLRVEGAVVPVERVGRPGLPHVGQHPQGGRANRGAPEVGPHSRLPAGAEKKGGREGAGVGVVVFGTRSLRLQQQRCWRRTENVAGLRIRIQ